MDPMALISSLGNFAGGNDAGMMQALYRSGAYNPAVNMPGPAPFVPGPSPSLPGVPPAPAAAAPAMGGIRGLSERIHRDPALQMALIQMGSRLLQGRRPGESVGGVIGQGLAKGATAYTSEQDRQQQKKDRERILKNSEERTGLAKNEDRRRQAEAEGAAAAAPQIAEARQLEIDTRKEKLRLEKLYGQKEKEAALARDAAATGASNASADLSRARAEDVRKGKDAAQNPSGEMQHVVALTGIIKKNAERAGRKITDDEAMGLAMQMSPRIRKSGQSPQEYELELRRAIPLNIENVRPSEQAQAQQDYDTRIKSMVDDYAKSIPNVTTLGADLGTPMGAPTAAAAPAQAPQGQSQPTIPSIVPGSGNSWWGEALAKDPNMNAVKKARIAEIIKANDPSWIPPADVAALLGSASR